MAHQLGKQRELARLQHSPTSVARDGASVKIKLDRTDKEYTNLGLDSPTPTEGMDARRQLGKGERFDQMIVGSAFQSFDAIADAAHGSKHENWVHVTRRAQRLGKRQAI